jgi:hypothetical protein
MNRIAWIDDLKGLGIFLIALGHVVATVQIMSNGAVANALGMAFDYIYSFHVPFFFLLAGLTFSTRKGFRDFAKGKFYRLMAPYFVWGMFSAALFVLMGSMTVKNMESAEFSRKALTGQWWTPFVSILHGGGWPGGKGFRFNGVLWFLPVLFSAELIYYPIAKRISKTWHFVAVASVVTVVLSPLYWPFLKLLLPYGLCRVPEYLVFILIGDWLGRTLKLQSSNPSHPLHISPSTRLNFKPQTSILEPISSSSHFPLYTAKLKTFNFKHLSLWSFLVVALLLGACLCVMCGELVRYPLIVPKALATIVPLLLIARFRMFKWFGLLAPHTLAIMIFHKFLLVPLQIGVTKSELMGSYPFLTSVLCVLLFAAICVGVCYFISKILVRYLPWTIGAKRVLVK